MVCELGKKFSAFYGNRNFITLSTTARSSYEPDESNSHSDLNLNTETD